MTVVNTVNKIGLMAGSGPMINTPSPSDLITLRYLCGCLVFATALSANSSVQLKLKRLCVCMCRRSHM